MLEELKAKVFQANMELVRYGLVMFTWGNASEIDRDRGLVVIKPSGVSYDQMKASDMVVVDLDGNIVDGDLRPSSDTPTHLEIYKLFPDVGGVVHTHSTYATAWAQARRSLPILGTTHADYFYGDVPCAREMSEDEVRHDYEKMTGVVIAETFKGRNHMATPGVLVANHGPFTWGSNAQEAIHNSVVLEEIARMALFTMQINPLTQMSNLLTEKHYSRKHGINAYYGQKTTTNE